MGHFWVKPILQQRFPCCQDTYIYSVVAIYTNYSIPVNIWRSILIPRLLLTLTIWMWSVILVNVSTRRRIGYSFMVTPKKKYLPMHQNHWVKYFILPDMWMRIKQVIRSLVIFILVSLYLSTWYLPSVNPSARLPSIHPRLGPKLLSLGLTYR